MKYISLLFIFSSQLSMATVLNCQVSESSIFNFVIAKFDSDKVLTSVVSSNGSYGSLQLSCEKTSELPVIYKCSASYVANEDGRLVSQLAIINLGDATKLTSISRTIKNGELEKNEELRFCKVTEE